MSEVDLRQKVIEARRAARLAERELLVTRGWEDQGVINDVTWWSYKGKTCSEPQETAIKYALRGVEGLFIS